VKAGHTIPIDWFTCPVTKSRLEYDDGMLVSSAGKYTFQSRFGYWDFMPQAWPERNRAEWKTWEQLQANGVVSYKADPGHNLGIGRRADFLEFATFCRFRGNVLDIGVGPQRCPTHIEFSRERDVFFVGIDPLVGDQPRCFSFVRGLGEYLPFRDGIFDQALFVTSLDHFIDPRPAMKEAARVLQVHGEICVWIGEKSKDAPKPAQSSEWYERLSIPAGAHDRFHFKRFTAQQFESYVVETQLVVVEQETIEVNRWRRNHFYRLGISAGQNARN
jgi:SAM-dependent methyltransferase